MVIYVLFFIVLIWGAIFTPNQRRNIFIITVSILFWVIIGLRDISIGTDTAGYVAGFQSAYNDSLMLFNTDVKEPLYTAFTWILAQLFDNYTIYLLFWGAFPAFSIYWICKNELNSSSEFLLSILVVFILGFYAFYVAGIRQSAAMSVCLFGWQFLKKNKLIPFLLTVAVAYLFHNSALLFAFVYFLRFLKVRWYYIVAVVGFFFLGNVVKISQLTVLSAFFFEDRFGAYGNTYESELSKSGFIMQFILYIICFLQKDRLIKKDENANLLFGITLVGLAFMSLTGMIAEMWRMAMYFSIFFILLLPKAVSCYSVKVRKVFYMMFTLGCLVYLFYLSSANMPPYKFA